MPTPGGYADRPLGNPHKDETILSKLEAFNQEAYRQAQEMVEALLREIAIPHLNTSAPVDWNGLEVGIDPARPGGDQTVAFRYDLETRSVEEIFWSRVEEKLRAEWAKEDQELLHGASTATGDYK